MGAQPRTQGGCPRPDNCDTTSKPSRTVLRRPSTHRPLLSDLGLHEGGVAAQVDAIHGATVDGSPRAGLDGPGAPALVGEVFLRSFRNGDAVGGDRVVREALRQR